MRYRADIDVLRAVAVLLVVLFHARLPPFTGGFVGVDVFFVISGYLITRIVTSQLDRGGFSLIDFYDSRLRRIVPALAAMVAVVFLGGTILGLFADDFTATRLSARSALCFTANHFFNQETGYFDLPAHSQVFLHAWSLAVEAQFYLLYPLVVVACHRVWPRRLTAVLALLATASFGCGVWLVQTDPTSAFFLLPSRAWELLAGGILASTGWTPASQAGKRASVGFGFLAILGTALTYDGLVQLPFPGWAALPPVLGAVAWIAGGEGLATTRGWPRLLEHPWLVRIGLLSYSLYLWHWPIFVFARRVPLFLGLLPAGPLGPLVASGLAAWLSWRFIESPARRSLAALAPWPRYAVVLAVVVAAWLPGKLVRQPFFLSPRQETLAASAQDRAERQETALIGVAGRPPTFLLLGDSHAEAISPCFAEVARQAGRSGRLVVGPGLVNAHRAMARDQWAAREAELRRLLALEPYETAFIANRWALDLQGYLPSERPNPDLDTIGFVYDDGRRRATGVPALEAALRDTIALLEAHGVRRIYLMLPIPECSRNIPQAASFLSLFHDDAAIDARLGVPLDTYRVRNAAGIRVLREVADAFSSVELLDPWPRLSDTAGRSRVVEDGRCLYYDDDHLSVAGAMRLAPLIKTAVVDSAAQRISRQPAAADATTR